MSAARITSLLLVLCVVGCRPKAQSTELPESAPNTATAAAEQEEPALDPQQFPTPIEVVCETDRDCETYLRCESGACLVPPAVDGRVMPDMPTATFTHDGKELATFYLEIADDDAERMRGLMHRRKMDARFGMLFVFDGEANRAFWMKNTLIPLDMVHIDAAGVVVGIVERAEPLTLTSRSVGQPARYVLELTGGRASEVGLVVGAKMAVTGLPDHQSPR